MWGTTLSDLSCGYDSMGRMNMMVADPGPGGGSTAASYSYTGGTNQLASLTARRRWACKHTRHRL
ncbi:MAG: hypothetical protein IPH79_05765 [Sphingomonadales bacterium]|nr:hypothetical protein [Sphingomonadales bacterium]